MDHILCVICVICVLSIRNLYLRSQGFFSYVSSKNFIKIM